MEKLEEFLGTFTTLVQAARIAEDTVDFRGLQVDSPFHLTTCYYFNH